jgi:hypothetical protein
MKSDYVQYAYKNVSSGHGSINGYFIWNCKFKTQIYIKFSGACLHKGNK